MSEGSRLLECDFKGRLLVVFFGKQVGGFLLDLQKKREGSFVEMMVRSDCHGQEAGFGGRAA